MDKITEMLTFKQIHELPEFAGCADYIVPVGGEQAQQMANTPLSFFAQIGWSPEAMAYGLEDFRKFVHRASAFIILCMKEKIWRKSLH